MGATGSKTPNPDDITPEQATKIKEIVKKISSAKTKTELQNSIKEITDILNAPTETKTPVQEDKPDNKHVVDKPVEAKPVEVKVDKPADKQGGKRHTKGKRLKRKKLKKRTIRK